MAGKNIRKKMMSSKGFQTKENPEWTAAGYSHSSKGTVNRTAISLQNHNRCDKGRVYCCRAC